MISANPQLECVLSYVRRGWRVLPCHSAIEGKCSCGGGPKCKPGKHPWTVHGWKEATVNEEQIRAWSEKYPGCNWAVATGQQSGVIVLDVDGEKGWESLAALEAQHGPLPITLASTTGRGGHRWFRYPAKSEIRNSAGKLGDGIDVRSSGGYVIVPPSVHQSGRAYQWANPQHPIADAPNWLVELLAEAALRERRLLPRHVGVLVEGERNEGLFRFACALRRKGLAPERIASEVNTANLKRCKPSPLPPEEIQTIVSNATKYPPGGPDPLETAWRAIPADMPAGYARFIALARQLQLARPGHPIALPVERIGELMVRDRKQIQRWRQYAVRDGWLQLKERALWLGHRAALYTFTDVPLAETGIVPLAERKCPTSTKSSVPLSLKSPKGIMGHSELMGQSENDGPVEIVI
jgi:hypothetical protein